MNTPRPLQLLATCPRCGWVHLPERESVARARGPGGADLERQMHCFRPTCRAPSSDFIRSEVDDLDRVEPRGATLQIRVCPDAWFEGDDAGADPDPIARLQDDFRWLPPLECNAGWAGLLREMAERIEETVGRDLLLAYPTIPPSASAKSKRNSRYGVAVSTRLSL